MSVFDEWWEKEGSSFRFHVGATQAAWNAALDHLEGLAEGWLGSRLVSTRHPYEHCANELLARIKELRT